MPKCIKTHPGETESSATVSRAANLDTDLFNLATCSGATVLALGSDIKAAACLYGASTAVMSRRIWNLTDPDQYRSYFASLDLLSESFGFTPELTAHDLHPHYLSTALAKKLGLSSIGVQHHHAHVVSVMAEQRLTKPVIGICCDGAGFGTDNATWGCEVLHCRADAYERVGHLDYFALPGGDAAAVETWRPAMALVQQAFGSDWPPATAGLFNRVEKSEIAAVSQLLLHSGKMPQTSSLGRVFDAASFLLGLCERNHFEAEAAGALERAATCDDVEPYPYETRAGKGGIGMSLAPAIRCMVREIRSGVSNSVIASRFHETVARLLATTALMAAEQSGIRMIVLAGGCFANRRLRMRVTQLLEQRQCQVVSPRRISFGDSSLALGQAVAAAAMYERNGHVSCDAGKNN